MFIDMKLVQGPFFLKKKEFYPKFDAIRQFQWWNFLKTIAQRIVNILCTLRNFFQTEFRQEYTRFFFTFFT